MSKVAPSMVLPQKKRRADRPCSAGWHCRMHSSCPCGNRYGTAAALCTTAASCDPKDVTAAGQQHQSSAPGRSRRPQRSGCRSTGRRWHSLAPRRQRLPAAAPAPARRPAAGPCTKGRGPPGTALRVSRSVHIRTWTSPSVTGAASWSRSHEKCEVCPILGAHAS